MSQSEIQHTGLPQADRLERIVNGLLAIVTQETRALEQGTIVDLSDFNKRKSHGLLELTRALRAHQTHALTAESAKSLQGLRDQLSRNETLLKVHLDAVQEIADVMTAAINESQSDGTYSATGPGAANFYV